MCSRIGGCSPCLFVCLSVAFTPPLPFSAPDNPVQTPQPYDRTSAIGIIATATRDMGNVAAKYGEELLPLMVNGLSDEE